MADEPVCPLFFKAEVSMLALLDHRAPKEAEKVLSLKGHSSIRLPSDPGLPAPVAAHADLLLYFAPNAALCTKEYFEIAKEELKAISQAAKRPLRLIDATLGKTYPLDVPLNAVSVGDYLFCNPKTVAKEIPESDPAKKLLSVKQGYTKCSILPVGRHAIITEDDHIAKIGQKQGLDVLQIQKGFVALPGYDTGFLGGASSFAPYQDAEEIFFCGDLQGHPNGKDIQEFCKKHQKQALSLGDFPLLDVGTVFLI
jgi:hypothetical protein